jgi:hypothetical protein
VSITIPTGDLVGVLTDVLPFASPDKGSPLCAVRLEWDGTQLHALATDRYSAAISTWDPDDDPESTEQEDLFTRWGGADDPAAVTLPAAEAKDVADVFKLGPKELWTPLTVDLTNGHRLKVVRTRDTGFSAITQVVEAVPAGTEFPDIRRLLAEANRFQPIDGLMYDAKRLALFAKVRQRGPLRLTFTHRDKGGPGLTHVAIGDRFTGAIMPAREKTDDEPEPAKAAA